ncbi:methyltransferase domain-containing protein [Methylocystis echinoides]|uniref:class I SAM-dependent methyltransferase n=1 Tax=Methylocystis echinoides TaxID=29468 RepID=UPI00343669AE
MVTYDRQTVNSPNPIARFAHRTRLSKSILLADKHLPCRGAVADFGAGNGYFLSALGDVRVDAVLYAIEPYMPPSADPRIQYISDLRGTPREFDVITALEVCEHLTDDQIDIFLADCKKKLRADGKLIISVPIMIGAALPIKELSRTILFQRRSDYSTSEILLGLVCCDVQRPEDRRPTHKGFDFRLLRKTLCKSFVIETELYSPLPIPWWANSQVFFVCRRLK